MSEIQKNNARRAVAIATAAYTDDTDSGREAALELYRQFYEENPEFETEVIMGFTNVVTYLLIQLEKRGAGTGEEILKFLGRLYA